LCENAVAEALTTRDFGEVAVFDHLAVVGGLFGLERLLMWIPAVLSGSVTDTRAHVCDDYARIAASSGWTPMMFMMRVRL
jgi:hypothetical protein